jgi:hypothetical protein
MKTTIKTLVSLFAMSSLAMAGTEAAASKATDAVKPATEAAKPALAKLATVTAKIVSVDNTAKTITLSEMVKGIDGKEMAKEVKMTWNEQTKLMWQGADAKATAATLTDLKAGETITIKVSELTANLANEIHIAKATPTADAKPVTTTK